MDFEERGEGFDVEDVAVEEFGFFEDVFEGGD